jgi:hypothetical protein
MVFGEPRAGVRGGDADTLSLLLLGLLLTALLVLGVLIPPPLQKCIETALTVLKG